MQISMYINSPGGAVTAGLAMYDTMQVGAEKEPLNSTSQLPNHMNCLIAADMHLRMTTILQLAS